MRFDLDGEGVLLQPQLTLDDPAGEGGPVHIRIGREVRIEVAHRAVELALDPDGGQLGGLLLQPAHENGDLLADRGRGGGLPVRARQHGHIAALPGEGRERGDHFSLHPRDDLQAVTQLQRVRHVVDVFRGACEVQKLRQRLQGAPRDLLFEEVLNRLDVVVGGLLNRFDARGILLGELADDGLKHAALVGVERARLGNARFGTEGQ